MRPVTVHARIRFLPTGDGGRAAPLEGRCSYRPNHDFGGPDDQDMYIGAIELIDGEVIAPGETVLKTVAFLLPADLLPTIRVGFEWRINEGLKLVGLGTVLSVVGA